MLRLAHRALHTHLIQQTGVKRGEAASGAVTLSQRFGSAANLNTHLHALVLDGVYQTGEDGTPVFMLASAPGNEQLQMLLGRLIKRVLRLLARLGHLMEEDGITYLARSDILDPHDAMAPLQAAASTWRIAAGPRAGRKVLTLVGGKVEARRERPPSRELCANAQGFSLHAGVHLEANDRQGIEQLCRYITRPAISNERLAINDEGNVILKLKTPWCNATRSDSIDRSIDRATGRGYIEVYAEMAFEIPILPPDFESQTGKGCLLRFNIVLVLDSMSMLLSRGMNQNLLKTNTHIASGFAARSDSPDKIGMDVGTAFRQRMPRPSNP